jgi:hypothetical protein
MLASITLVVFARPDVSLDAGMGICEGLYARVSLPFRLLATVWLTDLLTAWLALCPGLTGFDPEKLQVMRALGMSIDRYKRPVAAAMHLASLRRT